MKKVGNWASVAHACNPSYSGGRDEENHSSKSAQANSSRDLISKKPITKKGWQSGLRFRPWVQTPVLKKKMLENDPNFALFFTVMVFHLYLFS
jgi:hypothetical protein